MGEIIFGVDFKSKTKRSEDPINLPNKIFFVNLADAIFAEALDCAAPDIWVGKHYPGGIDDMPFDEGA